MSGRILDSSDEEDNSGRNAVIEYFVDAVPVDMRRTTVPGTRKLGLGLMPFQLMLMQRFSPLTAKGKRHRVNRHLPSLSFNTNHQPTIGKSGVKHALPKRPIRMKRDVQFA